MSTIQSEVIYWFKDAMPINLLEVNKDWHCDTITTKPPREPCDCKPNRCRPTNVCVLAAQP
jgi:hypothetical protein